MACNKNNRFGFCEQCLGDEHAGESSSSSFGNFVAWLLRGAEAPEQAFSRRPAFEAVIPVLFWIVSLAIGAFLRVKNEDRDEHDEAPVPRLAPLPPQVAPTTPAIRPQGPSQVQPPGRLAPNKVITPQTRQAQAPGRLAPNKVITPQAREAPGRLAPNKMITTQIQEPSSQGPDEDAPADAVDLLAGEGANAGGGRPSAVAGPVPGRLGPNNVAVPEILRNEDGEPDPGQAIGTRSPVQALKDVLGAFLPGGG